MMNVPRETMSVSTYFDLEGLWFSDIFDQCNYPWEILSPEVRSTWFRKVLSPNISLVKRTPGGLVKEDTVLSVDKGEVRIAAGAILLGDDIQLFSGVDIESTALVAGPTILGAGTLVRHGAYIRGGVVTGEKAIIGHATEVKNSYMLDGAKAAHFAYVGDSVIGKNVNLGAGTKLSNLRMDHGEVIVKHGSHTISTKLRKFGAIVGDGVEIGCNAVLNPGVLLGKKTVVYPCVSVRSKAYSEGSKII